MSSYGQRCVHTHVVPDDVHVLNTGRAPGLEATASWAAMQLPRCLILWRILSALLC